MNIFHSSKRGKARMRGLSCSSDDNIHYLLKSEEEILRSISSGAFLPGVLNNICSALDCQIGSVIALIFLPEDDASELANIATNATLFGLHTFFSAGIVAESSEKLGSLEIYCCDARRPSFRELQLIERAKCLAAIAIQLDHVANHQGNSGMRANRPARGLLLNWPVSMN
jgi:hypothetical protein